jgi:hypothetical protein
VIFVLIGRSVTSQARTVLILDQVSKLRCVVGMLSMANFRNPVPLAIGLKEDKAVENLLDMMLTEKSRIFLRE